MLLKFSSSRVRFRDSEAAQLRRFLDPTLNSCGRETEMVVQLVAHTQSVFLGDLHYRLNPLSIEDQLKHWLMMIYILLR